MLSGRLDGQLWRADVGVPKRMGRLKQGGAKRSLSPNQGPPDRPMGRVSAAGPPQDLRHWQAVWAEAEGRSGRPGRVGR